MKAISSAKIREGGMIEVDNQILLKLYSLYQKELYLYLYSLCGDRYLAEDLLHETFLKALLALPDGHSNMRAWLYMVARNLFYNQQKKKLREILMDEQIYPLEEKTEEGLPEKIFEEEDRRMLYQAILRLDIKKREIIQDSKDAIAEYNDNDWYLAYVSINDIVDYRDFIEWYQKLSDDKELEWGELWCAVHTEDADGYCVEPNIGFCPYPSGMSMNWDREKYPYLSLLDNTDICHDVDVTDEETMQTHFISMLSYIQDYDDIISMMGQTTDSPNRYQDMINYVKKNGLKIHGFAVYAKKKNLLELYKQDMVSYVQTILQN